MHSQFARFSWEVNKPAGYCWVKTEADEPIHAMRLEDNPDSSEAPYTPDTEVDLEVPLVGEVITDKQAQRAGTVVQGIRSLIRKHDRIRERVEVNKIVEEFLSKKTVNNQLDTFSSLFICCCFLALRPSSRNASCRSW